MRLALASSLAGLVMATSACAQPYDMGPGMMGGYGPGYGMGQGMMGGYGPGYGMGPGTMGGYGMGPGMMGGYGMGPGMMGGYGMGPGMMWGGGRRGGGLYDLDLSAEQRSKIEEIRRDISRRRWELMRGMHEQDWHMGDAWRDGAFDEKAARKAFEAMTEAHKKMFEASIEARKRIDAVLTPQQREQLSRGTAPR